MDALEKAEDTRIYNFPDFGDDDQLFREEPIYEEAKQEAGKKAGYLYEIWVYNGKGEKVEYYI